MFFTPPTRLNVLHGLHPLQLAFLSFPSTRVSSFVAYMYLLSPSLFVSQKYDALGGRLVRLVVKPALWDIILLDIFIIITSSGLAGVVVVVVVIIIVVDVLSVLIF